MDNDIQNALRILQEELKSKEYVWVIGKEKAIIYHKDKLDRDKAYQEGYDAGAQAASDEILSSI